MKAVVTSELVQPLPRADRSGLIGVGPTVLRQERGRVAPPARRHSPYATSLGSSPAPVCSDWPPSPAVPGWLQPPYGSEGTFSRRRSAPAAESTATPAFATAGAMVKNPWKTPS